MSSDKREGNCLICENFFRTLHWHHTIPQALGGKDSLQIPLCGSCHTILHAQAEAIVAYRRGGKQPKQFWGNDKQESNSRNYLEILVVALFNAEDNDVPINKEYKMPVSLNCNIRKALKLFRTDNALGSLPNAILYCIKYTLITKGYLQDEHHHSEQDSSKHTKRAKDHLW